MKRIIYFAILLICSSNISILAQTITIIGRNALAHPDENRSGSFLVSFDVDDPSYDQSEDAGDKGYITLSPSMNKIDRFFGAMYDIDGEQLGLGYITATSVRWGDGKQHQSLYTNVDGDITLVDTSLEDEEFSDQYGTYDYSLAIQMSAYSPGGDPCEYLYLDPSKFTHDTIISVYFLMDNDVVVLSNCSNDPMGYIDGWNSNHISGQNGSVYAKGETATITAHPRTAQYEFVRWSNGVTTPTLTIANIQNDTIVYAIFREKANTHTITFDPANGDEPTVVANVEDGATPTAPETPSKDPDERYTYLFDEWYMGDTRGIQPATCDTTYTAHYTGIANMYSLTLNAAAGQGTIVFVSSKDEEPEAELVTVAPEPLEFRYNTAVTLRAEAAEGYEFLAWQDDAEAAAERTVTILDDTELTATFQVKQPTGIEEVVEGKASNRKLIIDGQLIIQHDGKTFNAQGAEMR